MTAAPADSHLPAWRQRYRKRCRKHIADGLDLIPVLDFEAALEAYGWVEDHCRPAERAYLGVIDRYYLLVRLLHRSDLLTPKSGKRGAIWLYRRCREVEAEPDDYLDLWAREHYKGQMLDEPVPTPHGWRAFGDLTPGCELFGPDGKTCRVVARTEVFEDPDCYEVEFDDGSAVRVSSDHLWTVERRTRKRVPMAHNKPGPQRQYRETVTLATRDIAAHDHRQDNRLAVRVNDPLDLPAVDLPIDPYVLGVWLGDGTSASAMIANPDAEVFGFIEAAGYGLRADRSPKPTVRLHTVIGLRNRLNGLGLIGNKHIPQRYLRASIGQRLALLQGLMDSDGHCNTRGTATFVNINDVLVDGFCELAHTLGLKPHRRRVAGEYKGEPYPYWQVSFQAYRALPPFRLARKLARCKEGARPNPRRYIVACRKVPTVPMRCIQVDREDGLYLTGRAMVTTHNSTIITFAGCVQEILRDPEITIGIFSAVQKTAKPFLTQIKREFEDNNELKALYYDVLWSDPKRQAPKWSEDEGIVVKRRSNPKESTVEAYGLLDGQPTGRHFRHRVYDDVVTREVAKNPEMVRKVTEVWELSDNLGGGERRRWHIGTRYAFGDTYGIMIDRGVLKVRLHPATDNGRADGNPVLLTPEDWEKKKRDQPTQFPAQMLQNPAAGEETPFKAAWLKGSELRPETLHIYILGDPSKGSPNRRSDRTAIMVIGVDGAMNKYLLDGFRHRMKLPERWKRLKAMHKKWSAMPGVMSVEVGYERYGLQSDLEHFEQQMTLEDYSFPITEVAWTRDNAKSKEDRVERLVPDIKDGRWFLPSVIHDEAMGPCTWRVEDDQVRLTALKGAETKRRAIAIKANRRDLLLGPIKRMDEESRAYDVTQAFIEELLYFPFGSHDDAIDAASRVYDLDPTAPKVVRPQDLEPAAYHDS